MEGSPRDDFALLKISEGGARAADRSPHAVGCENPLLEERDPQVGCAYRGDAPGVALTLSAAAVSANRWCTTWLATLVAGFSRLRPTRYSNVQTVPGDRAETRRSRLNPTRFVSELVVMPVASSTCVIVVSICLTPATPSRIASAACASSTMTKRFDSLRSWRTRSRTRSASALDPKGATYTRRTSASCGGVVGGCDRSRTRAHKRKEHEHRHGPASSGEPRSEMTRRHAEILGRVNDERLATGGTVHGHLP